MQHIHDKDQNKLIIKPNPNDNEPPSRQSKQTRAALDEPRPYQAQTDHTDHTNQPTNQSRKIKSQ